MHQLAVEFSKRRFFAPPRIISVVIVRQANRETQYLDFIDSDSANFAIKLLMKQVDVISAVRGTDYEVPR